MSGHVIYVAVVLCGLASVHVCTGEGSCPEIKDAEKYMFTIGPVCYHYVEQREGTEVSFDLASHDCQSRDGNLLTIKDSATQTALVSDATLGIVSDNDVILMGLRLQDSEWKWVTGQKAEYFNWNPSSQTVGDCARMSLQQNGTWEKYSCGSKQWSYAYVCEYGSSASALVAQLWFIVSALILSLWTILIH